MKDVNEYNSFLEKINTGVAASNVKEPSGSLNLP
jgi:hypothetical protein